MAAKPAARRASRFAGRDSELRIVAGGHRSSLMRASDLRAGIATDRSPECATSGEAMPAPEPALNYWRHTMNMIKSLFLALVLGFASFGVFAAPININTASAEQLTALNGIGEAKAAAIVEYRKANGPFKSVDQLVDVKGIGLKLVDKNRDLITVDGKS
jgi:competence protein ComEA